MELHHRPSAYETDELLLLQPAIKSYSNAQSCYGRARTCDPRINNPLFYRLNYVAGLRTNKTKLLMNDFILAILIQKFQIVKLLQVVEESNLYLSVRSAAYNPLY